MKLVWPCICRGTGKTRGSDSPGPPCQFCRGRFEYECDRCGGHGTTLRGHVTTEFTSVVTRSSPAHPTIDLDEIAVTIDFESAGQMQSASLEILRGVRPFRLRLVSDFVNVGEDAATDLLHEIAPQHARALAA